MKPISSRLTIPNRIEHLNAIVAFVSELARDSGFNKKEITRIQLALEEAVTNVIRHGLEMNPEESFTILCEQTDSELQIRILGKGVPFDPARLPVYSPDAPLEQTAGLGTFLMKESMDEVRYINRGKEGMELCLVKHLGARRIDERLSPEEKKPFEPAPPSEAAPNYTIRGLLPDEAIEVAKCAYRAYGYTYAEYIYYPEKIVEYNQDGTMCSLVAVTEEGDLMGHMALKFAFPGASIAEAGVAFVKPKYRKLGLAGQLGLHAMKKGFEMNLAGIVSRPVTSHIITQKMSRLAGFYECGLFLGFIPGDLDFKSLAGKVGQRESELLCFKPLVPSEAVTLYPPESYRPFVEELFARMEIPFHRADPAASEGEDGAGASDLRLSVVPSMNIAEILVVDYGDQDFDTLRQMWRDLCQDKIDVINLYLNLEDPRCAGFAEQCMSLGFFLAGVLPGGIADRHALILQFLNHVKIDYDKIKLHSPEARELLRFIVADAPDSMAAAENPGEG